MIFKKVFVAGHNGMVGSSLVRKLKRENINLEILVIDHKDLNLINQNETLDFFKKNKPDFLIMAAAKVGGIYANNQYPANFIYENLMIEANLIHSAFLTGVKQILFLGSSCIYPKYSKQPIKEDQLLSGTLEKTNEPYAIAKIAGIKICESYNRQFNMDYRCVMPTNLYGKGDNYHEKNSHVIPGLIKRFHDAKNKKLDEVFVWGTGQPRREFLFCDDLADACIKLIKIPKSIFFKNINIQCSQVNIGTGEDIKILDLAHLISKVIGFKGKIKFDKSQEDGVPRKLLDVSKINSFGWKAKTSLEAGLKITYKDFLAQTKES